MDRKELLLNWFEGRYALGWRGYLARWFLAPVLDEMLCKENGLVRSDCTGNSKRLSTCTGYIKIIVEEPAEESKAIARFKGEEK